MSIAHRAPSDAPSSSDRALLETSGMVASVAQGDLLAGRYRVIRTVGRGGMGVVYEAEDREAPGEPVAIKLLTFERTAAQYQLKNEFRTLADLRHPNLVRLHQLVVDRGRTFLVMELVSGSDLTRFVNPTGQHCEEMRLRIVLPQLFAALAALHARGKVHRDLKPNNVLVTAEGRVVVIDFGLVENEREGGPGEQPNSFVGTPAYAAPEQVRGEPCGPEADLYALGVMLYEALTGAIPFHGQGMGVMLRKVEEDPPPPEGAPPDLAALCMALLDRDPQRRPTARRALEMLGAGEAREEGTPPPAALLLGRERELAALSDALTRTARGEPYVMFVHGPSGIGKTSLLREFAESARRERGALVLAGRCYAREQVPYKALDPLVEQLARHLAQLPPEERSALVPRDLPLLARIFPVLERFSPGPVSVASLLGDPLGTRERAFAALRELFSRIARTRPLVVTIDDMQWGDADSASLFRALFSPSPPPALFLCAYRSEERSTSPMLQQLFASGPLPVAQGELQLEPLSHAAASALVHVLVRRDLRDEDLDQVLRESRGSPFLLHELSRLLRRGHHVAVESLVAHRLDALDAGARTLLDIVCLAGRPLPLGLALTAAQAGAGAVLELSSAQLVRLRMGEGGERIEPYHDRVREVVADSLDAATARRALRQLAHAYERAYPEQVDVLMELCRRFGDLERAAHFAARAAEQAERAFAYERAAELYGFALQHAPEHEQRELEVACARASASAGRVSEAGERFERAARRLDAGRERRELLRTAMGHHLTAGSLDSGEEILALLCRELGVPRPPRKPLLAALALCWAYLLYRLGPRLRTLPAPVPSDDREDDAADERLALAFGAAQGLAHHSLVRSSTLLLRALVELRRARSVTRWPLGLACEAMFECAHHGEDTRASHRAVVEALRLAHAQATIEERARVQAAAGARAIYLGHADEAEAHFERAETFLREQGVPVVAVCDVTRPGRLAAWHALGCFDRLLAHADRWLIEARLGGDQFAALAVHVMGAHRFLALDDVASARASLKALTTDVGRASRLAGEPWWRADVELYAEEPERALAACRAARRPWLRLGATGASVHRAWLAFTEARAALACLAVTGERRHRRTAERALARLQRERYAPARGFAFQVEAALAFHGGDLAQARACLTSAAHAFEGAGFALYAEAARLRRAELMEGGEAQMARAAALAACSARGVKRPERWLRTLAPGFTRA